MGSSHRTDFEPPRSDSAFNTPGLRNVGRVPQGPQRADGSSKFCARNSELYATQDLLDAEARLLDVVASLSAPVADVPTDDTQVESAPEHTCRRLKSQEQFRPSSLQAGRST